MNEYTLTIWFEDFETFPLLAEKLFYGIKHGHIQFVRATKSFILVSAQSITMRNVLYRETNH